ncbi:META domain-containing protein [Roseovarius salinarum]|uniref:META domain-containing protein n=1 Tax=Roseovarius salinarum TaxID=1981892 RepID=UPI000C3456A0|nr:META domain-containing protein [Roseovarius salinarum]
MSRFLAVFALVCACAGLPAAAQQGGEDTRTISGALRYDAKMALPPAAEVVVEVRGALDARLGQATFGADGQQVPLPFSLDVPAELSGRLRAVIRLGGKPRWLVRDVPVRADATDLGEIAMTLATPLAFATRFDCGGTPVAFGMLDDRAVLRVGERDIPMQPAKAATGARHVATGGENAEIRTTGDTARVTVDGRTLPDCKKADPHAAPPYRAGGNEPGWAAVIDAERIEITADYGAVTHSLPRPGVTATRGAYRLDMPAIDAQLILRESICRDSATGMPHPHRAALRLGDRRMTGCGGDPASLLIGPRWELTQAAGHGVLDPERALLRFDARGRVSGHTGCNRIVGGYDLTGEGLSFRRMGATMMACPDAAMEQERRILDALARVVRFDIGAGGALQLLDTQGRAVVTARRP